MVINFVFCENKNLAGNLACILSLIYQSQSCNEDLFQWCNKHNVAIFIDNIFTFVC